jgi:hypothetical protein
MKIQVTNGLRQTQDEALRSRNARSAANAANADEPKGKSIKLGYVTGVFATVKSGFVSPIMEETKILRIRVNYSKSRFSLFEVNLSNFDLKRVYSLDSMFCIGVRYLTENRRIFKEVSDEFLIKWGINLRWPFHVDFDVTYAPEITDRDYILG